jgi:pyridoxine 4-dehydrogenase
VDGAHQFGVEGNLKRLGLDAMEVVNLRIVGSVQAPAEGTIARQVEALAELKQQGRRRHIG